MQRTQGGSSSSRMPIVEGLKPERVGEKGGEEEGVCEEKGEKRRLVRRRREGW